MLWLRIILAGVFLGGGRSVTRAQDSAIEKDRIAVLEEKITRLEAERIASLERDVSRIDRKIERAGSAGLVLILFGAFCALWAQNTGRSAWLWFFLGLAFNVLAVISLLIKNADDDFLRKQYGRRSGDQ